MELNLAKVSKEKRMLLVEMISLLLLNGPADMAGGGAPASTPAVFNLPLLLVSENQQPSSLLFCLPDCLQHWEVSLQPPPPPSNNHGDHLQSASVWSLCVGL